eukprot:m51a1_g13913 hypothetical protein (925) ;mRNA; r:791848-794838
MGGTESKPRPEKDAALYHLRTITALSTTQVKRLRVCWYELVPNGLLLYKEWPELFDEHSRDAGLPSTLWRVLKSEQARAIARIENGGEEGDCDGAASAGSRDEEQDPDIAGDDKVFDWFDFVHAFNAAVLLPRTRLLAIVFKLFSENDDWIDKDAVEKAGAKAGANPEQLAAEIASVFGSSKLLTESEFVAAANKCDCPVIQTYFGAIDQLRVQLRQAQDLLLTEAGPDGIHAEANGQLWRLSELGSWAERNVVVRGGFLWYYSADGRQLRQVVPLYRAAIGFPSNDERENCFSVLSGAWFREFSAPSVAEMHRWIHAILLNSREPDDNGLTSFSPPRELPPSGSVTFYADGEEYFAAAADAIECAHDEVMIAGWFLCPSVYMRRGPRARASDRLDHIIARKAHQGVKVYVLLWNETKIALELHSEWAATRLKAAGVNIVVVRHPSVFPLYWSHHQKLLVVDQAVAFVGGMDLAFGRWDTHEHVITDDCALSTRWPGKDYYNPDVREIAELDKPDATALDRLVTPRMPWHDVAVRITGDAAADVAWNFIQRWHHHLRDLDTSVEFSPLPLPPHTSTPTGPTPGQQQQFDIQTCQVVRSICEWSGGLGCESSCDEAYAELVNRSRRFIYIENQFFSSLLNPDGAHNKVGGALLNRLIDAITNKEVFRVIVMLPLHPEGKLASTSIRFIMKWQYDTICRGDNSILGRLAHEFPGVDLTSYITFLSLRQWGLLPPAVTSPDATDRVVTEMIYVHSKLMIVDDEIAILGSANINDRSLCGDRDSELSVVISGGERVEVMLGGELTSVSKSVHDLRVRLWAEHAGAEPEEVSDAVADETYLGVLQDRAANNTATYEAVFGPSIPGDGVRTLSQFKPPASTFLSSAEAAALLRARVRGHVVRHPLRFLEDEDLSPSGLDAEGFLDPLIFQ